jgi:3',5'-cyclic AMP phosphodiesterase CpdA
MMKKILLFFLIFLLISSCSSGHVHQAVPKSEVGVPVSLMIVGDLHYLSPRLYEEGDLFDRVVELGDGKVLQYTPQILQALVEEVRRVKPDGLILAGDITFNGERESHEEVAEIVKELCSSGIQVYAIPGNHDVNYPWTYKYFGDVAQEIKSITGSEFQNIYSSCGIAGSLSLDQSSCGFTFMLADDVWLLALDANARDKPGKLCKNTVTWVEEQLKNAKEKGVHVVSFSHQSLMDHNAVMYGDYTIQDAPRIVAKLAEGDVHLNLSAHLHVQHIAEEGGFYDVATGSLSIYPHLYGYVEIDENRNITYTAKPLPLPEEITQESRALFQRTTHRRIDASLQTQAIDKQTYDIMREWAIRVNNCYYRGEKIDYALYTHQAVKEWRELAGDTRMGRYLLSILEEPTRDHRHLFLERSK